MTYSRRTDERRRRVMMSTGTTAAAAPTASSRRRIEQLREARRPSMAYGSRVRRCLRGRWFSLVPVSRGAFVQTLAVLAVGVFGLILLHDASVRYASIADRPSWVEVFRINQYGSLGRYVIGLLYLATAGSAWLVYQLRRYRNDDFSGNYQLWQWIVCTTIAASFASTVPLIEMMGVGIEWTLGKRVALSGEDWIELFLMVGGAILALRIVAEMWRYRVAASLMLGGWVAMAVPIASQWNLIEVDNLNRWTIVTSAPLVAAVLWFASTVGYLRCLFREVRGIEPAAGYIQRLRVVAEDWTASATSALTSGTESEEADPTVASATATLPAKPPAKSPPKTVPTPTPRATAAEAKTDSSDDETTSPKKSARKGWWPFGRQSDEAAPRATPDPVIKSRSSQPNDRDSAKPISVESGSKSSDQLDSNDADGITDASDKTPKPKRRWWPSFQRKAIEPGGDLDSHDLDAHDRDAKANEPNDTAANGDENPTASEPAKKRGFGLGSLLKRRKPADANENAAISDAVNSSNDDDQDDDDLNDDDLHDDLHDDENSDDDIDWSSMNKAERRRMRKQLKRGKAA